MMVVKTNNKKLEQFKGRFPLAVEKVQVLPSSTSFVSSLRGILVLFW